MSQGDWRGPPVVNAYETHDPGHQNECESGGTLGTINQSGNISSSRNCKQGNWVGFAWVRKARTGKNALQICI